MGDRDEVGLGDDLGLVLLLGKRASGGEGCEIVRRDQCWRVVEMEVTYRGW